MFEVCKLNLVDGVYQLVRTGEQYDSEDVEEEVIETYRLKPITEDDLPKPLERPSQIGIQLYRVQGENRFLAICKGYHAR